MDAELAKMVDEYSKIDNVIIHTATWNVSGNRPIEPIDLKSWLIPENLTTRPDLFIIGF